MAFSDKHLDDEHSFKLPTSASPYRDMDGVDVRSNSEKSKEELLKLDDWFTGGYDQLPIRKQVHIGVKLRDDIMYCLKFYRRHVNEYNSSIPEGYSVLYVAYHDDIESLKWIQNDYQQLKAMPDYQHSVSPIFLALLHGETHPSISSQNNNNFPLNVNNFQHTFSINLDNTDWDQLLFEIKICGKHIAHFHAIRETQISTSLQTLHGTNETMHIGTNYCVLL
eukprot:17084_1